jgi:putative ATPase
LKKIIQEAEQLRHSGKPTVLFVDEIHHFNKAQQDNFLPHVERGTLTLIGATTENPSFEVISPLLSRCRVLLLQALSPTQIGTLIDRALHDRERGLGNLQLTLTEPARAFLIEQSQGDCRVALNALEAAVTLAQAQGQNQIDLAKLQEALQKTPLRYDKAGEEHYNVISAFIKSMRGSDPDGALYWMMRMLEAGEDPLFIARRMVIFAAEDIGNADPQALQIAIAAKDAFHFVGLPEGRIPLAQAVTYLASAPKSNASYEAMLAAAEDVQAQGALAVPLHLRNAPTPLMRKLGYGKDYQYAHNYEENIVDQQHLPEELRNRRYYTPADSGYEKTLKERLEAWAAKKNFKP